MAKEPLGSNFATLALHSFFQFYHRLIFLWTQRKAAHAQAVQTLGFVWPRHEVFCRTRPCGFKPLVRKIYLGENITKLLPTLPLPLGHGMHWVVENALEPVGRHGLRTTSTARGATLMAPKGRFPMPPRCTLVPWGVQTHYPMPPRRMYTPW